MAEEIDWIALESLKMALEAEHDYFARRYSEQEERLCCKFDDGLGRFAEAKRRGNFLGEGDYATAASLHRLRLAILENHPHGSDHPRVASALVDLASVLEEQAEFREGDYAAAVPLYRRALAIEEKHQGPDSSCVAFVLKKQAMLLGKLAEYAAAEPLYRRVIAIEEKLLGWDHETVAWNLMCLADMLWKQAEYAAAEPLYRRVLAIDEKNPSALTRLLEEQITARLGGSAAAEHPNPGFLFGQLGIAGRGTSAS